MQPPPLTPPSPLPLVVGLWAVAMVVPGLAVVFERVEVLLLMTLLVVPVLAFARTFPPPRAAVRALRTAGISVGFENGMVRSVHIDRRTVRLFTPRASRSSGSFVVSVPHTLPLADHTWVTRTRARVYGRHAPWDLRTKLLQGLDAMPPGVLRATLSGESLDFVLPRAAATALPRRLPECVAFTRHLERACRRTLADTCHAAGFTVDGVGFGLAGELDFRLVHGSRAFRARFGRYRNGHPHWRGRPELRVVREDDPEEGATDAHVFIGPSTRDLVADLRAIIDDPH